MSDALSLRDVDAFYGDSHVLHRVNMSLRTGSLMALLGRNGAGKTTTISAIMGLIRPRGGGVSLFGEAIAGRSPEAIATRGIGLVPQGRRIFPSLTVRENLVVAQRRARAGLPWTLSRVYEIFPRLGERAGQAAGFLSGGEQQMLAFGRALMGNPRVLLLDEPSEGLAPQIVAELGRVIAQLKAEGLSIVLVEQNIRLALSLADDAVILSTGAVVYQGTAAALAADDDAINRHLGVF